MKLLLTDSGITNTSIRNALVDLLGKPIAEHLDYFPDNSMANAEKWAASMPVRSYAIDYQTAIKVADGNVEVVPEGHWKLFTR